MTIVNVLNSVWFGKIIDRILSPAPLGVLIVTHLVLDVLALLRGLRGALASRRLKAPFLHISRVLGILSGSFLCHLIMADVTLNIAALLGTADTPP